VDCPKVKRNSKLTRSSLAFGEIVPPLLPESGFGLWTSKRYFQSLDGGPLEVFSFSVTPPPPLISDGPGDLGLPAGRGLLLLRQCVEV